jgi:hypothetical protein
MSEFEQKIFALKTLNELFELTRNSNTVLNAIQLISKSSYSYMIDDDYYNTVPSINHLLFTITHESGVYKCEGKNGANGNIAIYSTEKKDKYDG